MVVLIDTGSLANQITGVVLPQRTDAASFKKEAWPCVERLVCPALGKSPEDVAVSNNQNVTGRIAIGVLFLPEDGSMPLLTNVLNQPVKAFGDISRASKGRGWCVRGSRFHTVTQEDGVTMLKTVRHTPRLGNRLSKCPNSGSDLAVFASL